jgi:hypothetical protein
MIKMFKQMIMNTFETNEKYKALTMK